MNLLNVGCGGHRPGPPWTNLDNLRSQLAIGTPERTNLDNETNYVEANLLDTMPLPFPVDAFDGILIQHVLEHLVCHDAVNVLTDCRRVLKPEGVLVASVPDVSYFRFVHQHDTRETAEKYFGESISGDWQDAKCETFFEYALFHRNHLQVLNKDGLWALLRKAGFKHESIGSLPNYQPEDVREEIHKQLNRLRFSAILYAYK